MSMCARCQGPVGEDGECKSAVCRLAEFHGRAVESGRLRGARKWHRRGGTRLVDGELKMDGQSALPPSDRD